MSERPTRILVIRFSSIGDIVLTAPAVASLRAAVQGPSEIHYLTKAGMEEVVAGFGDLVDRLHTIEQSTAEVQKTLLELHFDYVVDLHNNVRSRAVKRALGLISFTVDKQNWAKWLLVRGWRSQPVSHIVERYIESFAGAFGATIPDAWPPLFAEAEAPAVVPAHYEVLALGATHAGKRLTKALIQSIIAQAAHPVVLIGGKADVERGEAFSTPNTVSLVGQTSVAESAAIIRNAQRVHTGDTGMMHLAAAMGVPITSFWGCTRPNLGMEPWQPAAGSITVVPDEHLGARPCSKLGNRCRHASPCMEATARVYQGASVK
jgi:ADP-heptose:LPS heptosyltransferase